MATRGYFHPSLLPYVDKTTTLGEIDRIKRQYGIGLSLELPAPDVSYVCDECRAQVGGEDDPGQAHCTAHPTAALAPVSTPRKFSATVTHILGTFTGDGAEPHIAIMVAFRQLAQAAIQ